MDSFNDTIEKVKAKCKGEDRMLALKLDDFDRKFKEESLVPAGLVLLSNPNNTVSLNMCCPKLHCFRTSSMQM